MEDHDEAVIANVAAALQAEEVALGLATPNGVGQRPKPMPADLSTGQDGQIQFKDSQVI